MPAIQLLCDESSDIRQSSQQGHLQIALSREAFQNGGEPKSNAVASGHGAEIAECQQDYIAVAESSPNAQGTMAIVLCLLFALWLFNEPRPLVRWQPTGLRRPVRQIEDRDHTEHDRRNAFQDEQPSP